VQVCFSLQTHFDQPFWTKSGKQWALQLNAGASHSRQMPVLQAKKKWGVLARRRATLRQFSAVFLSIYTFQK